jgi:hypothetical protein
MVNVPKEVWHSIVYGDKTATLSNFKRTHLTGSLVGRCRKTDMTKLIDKHFQIFIKKDPTRCNNVSNFIIPYLYEA